MQVTREEPPDRIRILLDLPDDEPRAIVRRRRFVLDGKPVLLSASYLPADIAGGTPSSSRTPGQAAHTPGRPTPATYPSGSAKTSEHACPNQKKPSG